METSNQIRLLHIVGSSNFGGAARLILRLAELAGSEGWQADILTTDPAFQKAARQHGIGVVNLDVIRREIRPLWDAWGLAWLYRFLRRERYTIVHTHTSKGGCVGRVAARLAGVPVVVHTAHGFAFHERTPARVRRVYVALERMAAPFCDRIVCVSGFHRQWALDLGICGAGKVMAIPNGITPRGRTPGKPPEELRRGWGVGGHEVVILSMGRLAPEKGLEELLEAGAGLLARGKRFRLAIAGDGGLRGALEARAARLGIARQVLFLGYREDVGDVLAACDVVALPSLREGLSIALLEAMAAGKPVITTTIGSNVEVAAQAEMALLVPPGDPAALGRAMERCLDDATLRADLGKNALALFESRYREDRMLEAYRQVYLELLAEQCPAAARAVAHGREVRA